MPRIYLMPYTLERRTSDRIDDLYDIILACGEDMYRRLGLDHWRPPTPKEMYREFATSKRVYAVHENGVAVATFTLTEQAPEPYPLELWTSARHRALYLVKLAVHPSLQGKGLGRWCMERVEQTARAEDFQALRFDALARNAPLLRFYEHLGYRRAGDMRVKDEIDREWDIVLYEKVLA
jgi:GNAT superfamily N-acetyltransferase